MRPDEFEDFENEDEITQEEFREDKIFNNKYNTGDGLTEVEDYEFSRKISVAHDYSDLYLKDVYEYEEELESKFILDEIFKFIQNDSKISKIVDRAPTRGANAKSKLSKDEINFIFTHVNSSLDISSRATIFYNPIYILEAISTISSIEYKKIFDSLDTETQELLLVELNKKYKFLDGKFHKKRIH
jgi:hypothetical protein